MYLVFCFVFVENMLTTCLKVCFLGFKSVDKFIVGNCGEYKIISILLPLKN
jgi:hypothetical protein